MTKVDWIPFSEQRPDSNRRVLVWYPTGAIRSNTDLDRHKVNGATHWAECPECPEGPEPDTPEIRLIDRMLGDSVTGATRDFLDAWRGVLVGEAQQ